MQIVRNDVDALNISISLTVEPSDYASKFESEVKKYKNQAQLKGFRKGMTPASVIKKMYGKAILSDVINETVQTQLFAYIDEQKINYLGQPLPTSEEQIHLNINELQSYQFHFDLGVAPTIEVQGVTENDEYTFYDVTISDSLVEEELTAARRRYGNRLTVTDSIENMDMVKFSAEEMSGEEVKENGWKTEFSILVDIVADEKVKQELLTKKTGEQIIFDVFKLENKDEDYIKKYILKLPEGNSTEIGNMFKATIIEVSRVELAAIDETFMANFGDENIKDEEGVKDFFSKDLKAYYDNQARQYMYREIMDYILAHNEVPLPEDFLKRYLKVSNDNVSDEILESEFGAFIKNMKWSLQKNHLARTYGIEVVEDDVRRHFTNSVFSYMRNYGNMDFSFISQTVDRLMKDKDQVNKAYEEILADKVFNKIGDTVKKNKIEISHEAFLEKVKALNEKVNNF